jgi:hypothetical protein
MKAKREITAEVMKAVIERDRPTSLTGLAHGLGYKGSVSSSLTRKFRQLIPDIDFLLKGSAVMDKCADGTVGKPDASNGKPAAGKAKAKPTTMAAAKRKSKWPHDERSPFRPGSSYDNCYSILAAHTNGLPKAKLVELLANATGKDVVHAGYDAQVLMSAGPNENGLSNNDSPRHRSCRAGFWVKKTNGHIQLMVD